MTRLSKDQERSLASMAEAKAKYDAWEAAAQIEFAVLKSQQKEPMRKMVAKAIADGIPVRQIHLRGMGFGQAAGLTNFLDGAKVRGKEALIGVLSGAVTTAQGAPVVKPTEAAPTITQVNGYAHWTDPTTGEAKKIGRVESPADFYIIFDSTIALLSDAEKDMFLNHEKTLFGDEEYDEYMNNGNMPERWDHQPDAAVRKRQ